MANSKISVENLNLHYGENHALKDVNMEIADHAITAFIGPSGCGKSTFLRCLNRMNDLVDGCRVEGKVILDGEDIYDKRVDTTLLRKKVGMVFQQPNPFPMSIYDNIAYGPRLHGIKNKKELDEIVERSLQGAAIFEEVKDRLHKSALGLSGGQQQRLCIARALAVSPEVLLMDEPTSALDPNTTAGVLSLLKDINTRLGITIVVITHEMSVIQEICDRVAIIDGGLIAEEGGVEEIFRAPKTKIGQELVMHEGTNREAYTGKLPYSYRLVFKGGSENEPVLGQMMIELKNVVNILAANTRTIENQAFGQMLVQFPEEKEIRQKMIQYLTDRGVEVEEVEYV